MAIFAAREHHCAATFPAMYFLLSLTVPISLLLIIIISLPPSPSSAFYRQRLPIIDLHIGQLIPSATDFPPHLFRKVSVLHFPYIKRGIPEQSATVPLYCPDMVRNPDAQLKYVVFSVYSHIPTAKNEGRELAEKMYLVPLGNRRSQQ